VFAGCRMMEEDKAMTGEAEKPSEFLEAMQQAADILAGKLAPARVHRGRGSKSAVSR